MTNLSSIIDDLPRMNSGDKLIAELKILPEYNPEICNADAPMRLMALSDLYRIYLPSQMSLEIYSKLYLALLRSMQKKGTKLAVQQIKITGPSCSRSTAVLWVVPTASRSLEHLVSAKVPLSAGQLT